MGDAVGCRHYSSASHDSSNLDDAEAFDKGDGIWGSKIGLAIGAQPEARFSDITAGDSSLKKAEGR